MATAIVRHRVNDFETWKSVFDDVEPWRREQGMTSWALYTAATDTNDVTAVLDFETLGQAQAHFQDAELKAAMQKAGVVSKPEITFLVER